MQSPLTIEARFRGPPNSGNGGYVAGAIAERFELPDASGLSTTTQTIEVTLRAPIPLDQAMDVQVAEADVMRVKLGDTLIAEAVPAALELDAPSPPSFSAAEQARPQSASFTDGINPLIPDGQGFHPICFCCGATLAEDAGLHVHAAPVAGFDGVAAAWRPHSSFANSKGVLPTPIVWTALDCPGQFAYYAAGIKTGLLGRMTARILKPVNADQNLVVTGWCIEIERSKHFAGTALFDESGDLCAYSKQVWIGRQPD